VRKIPTLFRRDPDNPKTVLPEVHPDCQWVLDGEGTPTRKWDGTCVGYFPVVQGEVRINGGIGSHEVNEPGDLAATWLARREVKPGKTPPPGFLPIQTDEVTGKTVGWEPVEQSAFARWHADALTRGAETGYLTVDSYPRSGPEVFATYELCGPKINGDPGGLGVHMLIRHGYVAATEQWAMAEMGLDFASLRTWLLDDARAPWEGIVWHHLDGRMAKLKKRDFPPN
jgi:hypothetical protein